VLTGVATFETTPPVAALPFRTAELDGGWRATYCVHGTRPAYRHTAEDSIDVAPEARGLLLDALLAGHRAVAARHQLSWPVMSFHAGLSFR
jgi:L-amino acid N-acyltransferase YncA